jgi:hypothetical protein
MSGIPYPNAECNFKQLLRWHLERNNRYYSDKEFERIINPERD